jgi:hypothetical protein
MQCPVCEGPAKDITRRDFDGLVVRCEGRHKDFEVVGGGVLEKLQALDLEDRERAFKKTESWAEAGTRPAITIRCL